MHLGGRAARLARQAVREMAMAKSHTRMIAPRLTNSCSVETPAGAFASGGRLQNGLRSAGAPVAGSFMEYSSPSAYRLVCRAFELVDPRQIPVGR